jgi:hypothetical protein
MGSDTSAPAMQRRKCKARSGDKQMSDAAAAEISHLRKLLGEQASMLGIVQAYLGTVQADNTAFKRKADWFGEELVLRRDTGHCSTLCPGHLYMDHTTNRGESVFRKDTVSGDAIAQTKFTRNEAAGPPRGSIVAEHTEIRRLGLGGNDGAEFRSERLVATGRRRITLSNGVAQSKLTRIEAAARHG